MNGTFDLDGDLPVNPDGGLKSFGHPIGASGLRMMFECWLQLRNEAPPERQIETDRKLGSRTTWVERPVRACRSCRWSARKRAETHPDVESARFEARSPPLAPIVAT